MNICTSFTFENCAYMIKLKIGILREKVRIDGLNFDILFIQE